MQPTETELASQALAEESSYRFPYFSANDAVTLGLSLRKRFRASTRYSKGKGLVITVQTIAGHTLFSCTVGDLGGVSGVGDVSLDSWSVLEGMVNVVKRTGHSSYYVEKGMSAMAKGQAGVQTDLRVYGGGEFLQPSVSVFPSFTHPGLQHFRYGWRYASDPPRSFLRVLTSRILERAMLSHRGYRVLLRLESGRPSRTPLELLFED